MIVSLIVFLGLFHHIKEFIKIRGWGSGDPYFFNVKKIPDFRGGRNGNQIPDFTINNYEHYFYEITKQFPKFDQVFFMMASIRLRFFPVTAALYKTEPE